MLAQAPTRRDPVFGFDVVTACPGVPPETLWPREAWTDATVYDAAARRLADLFRTNFKKYEAGTTSEVRAAGPA